MDGKICTKCEETKQLDAFYKDAKGDQGRSAVCKECKRAYQRDQYAANPNRDRKNVSDRRSRLKTRYDLDPERYQAMLTEQGGGCAICGESAPPGTNLAVDHNHRCCPGKKTCGRCVRALLCTRCNRMLGLAQDDPGRLRAAADYLEEH